MVQTLKQAFINKFVKHLKLIGAMFKHVRNHVLKHCLGDIHILCQVAKSHLRLNHPKLRRMTTRIGVLGTKCRTKGIHIAKGHGKVLSLKLTGNRQMRGSIKEILRVINFSCIGTRNVLQIKRSHLKHLSGTLGIRGGNDRCINVDKALILKEFVDSVCGNRTHAKYRTEKICARTKMLLCAQILQRLTLFLHRIFGARSSFNSNGMSLKLNGLRALRRQFQNTVNNQGRANTA